VERAAVDPATANPGTAHFCLYVNDIESLYDRLIAGGARSVSEIKSPNIGPNKGGKAVYMIDPDGIRFELVQTTKTLAGDPWPPQDGRG